MSAASHRITPDSNSTDRVEALRIAKSSMWAQLDLLTVMQASINAAVELTGLDTGAIYLLQENVLYLGATTPPLPPGFPHDLRYANALDHPHLMHAVDRGKPLVVHDLMHENTTQAESEVAQVRGIRSILYVPLFSEDRPIGVFMVGSVGEPAPIPPHDVSVSQALAESIAHAIEDAHLFDTLIHHTGPMPGDVRQRLSNLVAQTPRLAAGSEKRRIEQLQHRLQRRLTLLQIRDQLLRDEIENAQAVHSRSLSALEDELDSYQRLLADTRDELVAFTPGSGEREIVESGLEQALHRLLRHTCSDTGDIQVSVATDLHSADLDTTLLTYRATRNLLEALCVPAFTTDASVAVELDDEGRIVVELELQGPTDAPTSPRRGEDSNLDTVVNRVRRAGGELKLDRDVDRVVATASLPYLTGA